MKQIPLKTKLKIPDGARPAARAILYTPDKFILLQKYVDSKQTHHWWITPGGGVETGESFQSALRRELIEETGQAHQIGRLVWYRHHRFDDGGIHYNLYERFFLVPCVRYTPKPTKQDAGVKDMKWWSFKELQSSQEMFGPRKLPTLLSVAVSETESEVFDCGI